MRSEILVTCIIIWIFLAGQTESRYPLPILPKSKVVFGAKEQDSCQDEVKYEFYHGNVKISYAGVASDCSWKIPQISQIKYSVMVYKMDKVTLSRSTSECNGLLKFPGQGFRCNMKVGDCFIYTTVENTCDVADIVKTMKGKLQCAESVIRKIPKEDMSQLSFSNNHANTFETSFEITGSYHNMECGGKNESANPGHISQTGSYNTTAGTKNITVGLAHSDNGNILHSPKMVGFLMLSTVPVTIAIIGITLYAIRRIRSNTGKGTSKGQLSEVTHESFITRDREVNEYVEPEYIIEYEMHPRNSFVSFPDSENISDVVPYTYNNETVIPEKNGYLIPTKNAEGYVAPPDEYASVNSRVSYVEPPQENDEHGAAVYNDDPFVNNENPYEIVRDVHYRSESYAE